MAAVKLARTAENDAAFLFRCEHIVAGQVRLSRPTRVHVVAMDHWFGPRWCGFAGTVDGRDVHATDRLRVPPFAPARVRSETTYRRVGRELHAIDTNHLHDRPPPSGHPSPFLDGIAKRGVFVWYSADTAKQDRASLMVYDVTTREQQCWYAGFVRRGAAWLVDQTLGIDKAALEGLETCFDGRLAPLPDDDLWFPQGATRDAFILASDAWDDRNPALARCMAERILADDPGQRATQALLAEILTAMRNFPAARALLESIRPHKSRRAQTAVPGLWAEWFVKSGDEAGAEPNFRELAEQLPDRTWPWILLGACLARQGKLDEALAIHRHATTLEGDPDEAYLNVGLVLRGLGRLADAAEAFEAALDLSPNYDAASEGLADVRAALAWLERH